MRGCYHQNHPTHHFWLNNLGDKLTRSGLRQMLIERAKRAGVTAPQPHAFRRLCCLTMLRAGVDMLTVQRYLGLHSVQVIMRYAKLTDADTREGHIKGSPVERLF